jgi:hypothetical protein
MPTDLTGAGSTTPPTSGAFVGGTMDSSGATTITTGTIVPPTVGPTSGAFVGGLIIPTGTPVTL